MQGHKGTISSLPEILKFEQGSTSSGASIEQQHCWNNSGHHLQGQSPECLLSPDDTNIRHVDSVSPEPQDIRNWSVGASSSVTQNEIICNEMKTDHGWPSPMTVCASAGASSEERWPEQDSLFIQGASSDTTFQNVNLNVGLSGDIDNSRQVMEHSNLYKSSGLENEQVLQASSSWSFPLSSGDGEYSMLQNDGQPGGPYLRTSCKRKAVEGNAGQPSTSANSSYLVQGESSSWPGSSAQSSEGSGISALPELANPSLDLGVRVPAINRIPDATMMASVESTHTHRNVRARTDPSSQRESPAPSLLSSGSTGRHFVSTSLPWLSRSIPIDHSLNLMTAPVSNNVSARSQNMAVHVPALPQNMQPLGLNVGSGSRATAFSSPSISFNTGAVPLHQQRPRRTARNVLDCPLFVPTAELRHLNQTPANICSNVGNNVPGNVATVSRPGSSSVTNLSPPSWVSHSNPHLQYSRRFSELVRRSLLSSLGPESGGQNSIQTSLPPAPHTYPGETIFPSGVANRGLPRLHPRSVSALERQGDAVPGIPQSLRTLAAGSEGRHRLVSSEIRNVLDLMRRGQGLRFEDVVILDQSVFVGVADIHDRHRDMRLDVDNMSYEELLALEERIGNVCTGLDEETIFKRLKQRNYPVTPGAQVEAEPCCICQEEYKDGEDLGTLECGHDFHTNCIKQWLMHKNLCPICKTTGLTK